MKQNKIFFIKHILLTILIVHLAIPNFAATYYVSNAGNDSNNGLSAATPWKTLAKVRGTKFVAGDIILLKSGDIFSEAFSLPVSGSVNNRITVSSYGGNVKPEIRGYGEISGWRTSGNWSLYSTGIYRKVQTSSFKRLWINGIEKKESKTLLAISVDFPWKYESGYLYIKSSSNPATTFTSLINGLAQWSTANIVSKSNFTIDGLKFTGGSNSMRLENNTNFTIQNCEIGYRSNGYGMWVVSSGGVSTDNAVITNNVLDTGDELFYNYYRGYHATDDGIYLGQGAINCKIHNNYFKGWSHTAIALVALNADYPFHDNEVYDNFITAPVLDYARGFEADYKMNGYNISFHHNTIFNTSVRSQINGNNLKFHDNIIDKVRGCPYPEKPHVGNGFSIEGYVTDATNMEIYNNTITNCANAGVLITWYGNSTQKAYNTIHDNNIFNNDTITHYQLWIDNQDPSKSVNHNTYVNNHFYQAIRTNIIYTRTGVKSVSTFNGSGPCLGDLVSGNDALLTFNVIGSGKHVVSINDLKLEYNGTGATKTITLDFPVNDLQGKKYSKTFNIKPYTSVILMKDYSVQSGSATEHKSICEGSSYNGWTKTGKYERTLTSKSGGDSIVTTYLTVNLKYAIVENITIHEGESYKGWTKSGQYTRNLNSVSGCDSVVTTNLQVAINTTKQADIEYTQTIELVKGYNLISTYLTAQNSDASLVTKSLSDQGSLIKLQDDAGNSLENWGNYGGWINNLGSIKNTEGYKIMVSADCSLQISGKPVALPFDIPLNSGWNIISFPRTDIVNAMSIIQPLIDQNILEKVQDEAGNSIENWGIYGGWENSIGNFVPGKAYKVKMKENAKLTILENYAKSAIIKAKAEKTEYFSTNIEGNGSDHMNINLVGLREAGISLDDELAAFDGNLCVGVLKITENHLINGTASLIASFSTNDQNQNGFNADDPIQIYVWKKLSGEKLNVNVEVIAGHMNFQKNATILINMQSLATVATSLGKATTINVFPNPSNGLFTIRFSELPDKESVIDILDISGRKIASRLVTQLSEVFNLEEQAPGLYLVKTTMDSKEEIRKLIIN